MKLLATIAFLSLIWFGRSGYAQDEQRPKDFFDRNYVNRGAAEGGESVLPRAASPSPNSRTPNSGTPKRSKTEVELEPEEGMHERAPSIDPAPETASEPENGKPENQEGNQGNGTPILSVGAILNRADVNHFEQALERLVAMAERTKVKLGPIFVTGPGPRFSPDFRNLQLRLMTAGGQLRYGANKPELFKVNKSPSWLIESKEGVIVIEGAQDIGRYVTNKGLFAVPEGSEVIEGL